MYGVSKVKPGKVVLKPGMVVCSYNLSTLGAEAWSNYEGWGACTAFGEPVGISRRFSGVLKCNPS